MTKANPQGNAIEQVTGRVHLDRVAACLDRSGRLGGVHTCKSKTGREEDGSSSSHSTHDTQTMNMNNDYIMDKNAKKCRD